MSGVRRSYEEILRSSSIMAAGQALSYLISMVRVKMVAVLLGPSGVGLLSLYTSTIGVVGAVSGLGISNSGVREIALAFSQQDSMAAARTVRVLRRACWITGLLGWALAAVMAPFLSRLVFDSDEHAPVIAVLGVTLLLGAIGGGQTALLQGVRRIGDIARLNVAAVTLNTGVAIAIYAWLGQRGIVPALIAMGAVSVAVSWVFSRRIHVERATLSWPETWRGTRRLAGLGMAVMWSGLLTAGLDIATRSLVTRAYGVEAAGLYQAAWALSGIFASFVLSAMAADFYPRLTSVIHDHDVAGRAVNEQTEVGMLLALPGLLGTLTFAPSIVEIFYTTEFSSAADLLPWFVVGIFGRVLSWPLGFIQLAKGASRSFAATETIFIALQLLLVTWALPKFGLLGVAYAFVMTYVAYTITMLWVSKALIGLRWSADVKRLMVLSGLLVMGAFAARLAIHGAAGVLVGAIVTLAGAIVSLRGLTARLGAGSTFCRVIHSVPGAHWITGSEKAS